MNPNMSYLCVMLWLMPDIESALHGITGAAVQLCMCACYDML